MEKKAGKLEWWAGPGGEGVVMDSLKEKVMSKQTLWVRREWHGIQ